MVTQLKGRQMLTVREGTVQAGKKKHTAYIGYRRGASACGSTTFYIGFCLRTIKKGSAGQCFCGTSNMAVKSWASGATSPRVTEHRPLESSLRETWSPAHASAYGSISSGITVIIMSSLPRRTTIFRVLSFLMTSLTSLAETTDCPLMLMMTSFSLSPQLLRGYQELLQ